MKFSYPRAGEIDPTDLNMDQLSNLIKQIFWDIYSRKIHISIINDAELVVHNKFRISKKYIKEAPIWYTYSKSSSGWSVFMPMGQDSPIRDVKRIVAALSYDLIETWLLTNYFHVA